MIDNTKLPLVEKVMLAVETVCTDCSIEPNNEMRRALTLAWLDGNRYGLEQAEIILKERRYDN